LLLLFSAHAPFLAALAVESRVLNQIPLEFFSSLLKPAFLRLGAARLKSCPSRKPFIKPAVATTNQKPATSN
jgi:hypothetical protein